MSIEEHDDKMTYCRMLGHEVPFGYCRKGATGHCCRKLFDCWFGAFDIEGFVRTYYTDEEIEAMFAPPKPKMTTLVELIQKAKGGSR